VVSHIGFHFLKKIRWFVGISGVGFVYLIGILLVDLVALLFQELHFALREVEELNPGLFCLGDLLLFLESCLLADFGTHLMHHGLEGDLEILGKPVEPCFVEDPDEKTLGVVNGGVVLGHLEFFGDVADDGGVVQTGDDSLFQGHGYIGPRHDHGIQPPLIVEKW